MDTNPHHPPTAPASSGEATLRLRSDLIFESQALGDQDGYICRDPLRGEYFRFGQREFELATLLNGSNEIADVLARTRDTAHECDEIELQRLIIWLVQNRLIDSGPSSPDQPSASGNELLQALSKAVSIRIPLIDADRPAKLLSSAAGACFSPLGFLVWTIIVLAGLSTLSIHSNRFFQESRHVFDPSSWIWLGTIWCIIKLFHEAGHAISASRQGVRVGKGGLILLLFAPIAFVDVTDSWRLKRAWSRIQIALAGVYVELAIAAIAMLVWVTSSTPGISNIALNVFLAAGPTTLLVNANPLMRLDGYFALADIVGIPNLSMHGSRQLVGWVEWILLGRRRSESMLQGWRRPFATIHAAASVVYKTMWIASLLVLVSTYFSGLGIILAAIAFLLWVLTPFARWIGRLWVADDRAPCFRRLAEASFVLAVVVAVSSVVRSPMGRSVPVVVQHKDHRVLRARTTGFVTKVHVTSGQEVAKGELLLELSSPQLEVGYKAIRLSIKEAEIRKRQLNRQSKQALAQAEDERLKTLLARETELKSQMNDLRLTAPIDGRVLSPNINRIVDTYVGVGDVLVEVGRNDGKELLASVGQRQVSNYRIAAESNQITTVRLRGGKRIRVQLVSSDPRGSTQLPHPALAATAGGPIAVEASKGGGMSAEDLTMTEPRFEALIPIGPEDAQNLKSGQRGSLSLTDTRTIFQLIQERVYLAWDNTTRILRDS